MPDSFDSTLTSGDAGFLWVDLMRKTGVATSRSLGGTFDMPCVREPMQIQVAIQRHCPKFLCFEFDEPNPLGMSALAKTRRENPDKPVLMITSGHSEAVAIWALRMRVWDLLVKPLSNGQLSQCISALIELTRQSGSRPARPILFPPQNTEAMPRRTHLAIAHVAMHFDSKIALDDAAALCQLSPSQFCRIFRQEQGVSFGQYLLHYRLERACEGLTQPGALAKEVAYSVGFNDLSYFSWAFKRQIGVCPSDYQAGARSS
jgi:two-component system, response regulator YesN